MFRKHRLQTENVQMVEPEKKQGFIGGMLSFYGSALSSAKNKLAGAVKSDSQKSGERASYDNTKYNQGG